MRQKREALCHGVTDIVRAFRIKHLSQQVTHSGHQVSATRTGEAEAAKSAGRLTVDFSRRIHLLLAWGSTRNIVVAWWVDACLTCLSQQTLPSKGQIPLSAYRTGRPVVSVQVPRTTQYFKRSLLTWTPVTGGLGAGCS